MKKGRAALGLVIAVMGILVTRIGPGYCADTGQQMIVYMAGVLLGLAGLGVIAFSLTVTKVKMVQCPHCFAYFEPKFQNCPHCSKTLPVGYSAAQPPREKTDEQSNQLSSDSRSVE